ncbi:hypothetical protein TRAPUB_1796 [Trametes pubescens]|uniref:Uncharacterized protein n=1 Tax=Trametes pubescens TaxID=154538 RepID=A0A1M2VIA5_TRAPU|nr:hypothetical protein TRAPUB_1796 [Trametes pubescens]
MRSAPSPYLVPASPIPPNPARRSHEPDTAMCHGPLLNAQHRGTLDRAGHSEDVTLRSGGPCPDGS